MDAEQNPRNAKMEDGGAVSTRPLGGLNIESLGMMISAWHAWYLSIRRVTPVSRDSAEVGRVHSRVPSGRSKGSSPTDGGIWRRISRRGRADALCMVLTFASYCERLASKLGGCHRG